MPASTRQRKGGRRTVSAERQFTRSVLAGLCLLGLVAVAGPLLSYRGDVHEMRDQFRRAVYDEFRERYARELDAKPDGLAVLLAMLQKGTVTLVYAAKDEERNNAVALKAYIEKTKAGAKKPARRKKAQ